MKQILFLSTLLTFLFLIPNECVAQKKKKKKKKPETAEITVPDIDLTHWKVTIPARRDDGKPIEVSPPEIFDYANNEVLTHSVNRLPSTFNRPIIMKKIVFTVLFMGEWALIVLGLMAMIVGVIAIRQRKLALAGAGSQNENISLKSMPFNKAAFGKALWVTAGVGLAIFVTAITVFGYELTSADIPGSLVSIPLVAYLITLIKE